MNYAARHVLILGLGESGLAAARWLARLGARLTIADSRAEPPGRADAPAGASLRCGPFDAIEQ